MKKIWKITGTAKSTELVFARSRKSAQINAKESLEYRFNTCLKELPSHIHCDLYIYETEVDTHDDSNSSYEVSLYANVYAEIEVGADEELLELVSNLPDSGFAGFKIRWDESARSGSEFLWTDELKEVA